MTTDPQHSVSHSRARFDFQPFWQAIILFGAGASICTLLGFMGAWSWLLDLFAHFRVQYFAGLFVLAIILFAGRKHKPAIVFLLFAGINLIVVAPLYVGRPASAADPALTHRAMLINVNMHFGNPDRVKAVVADADPDVLVLEEINARWIEDLEELADRFPYKVVQSREDHFGIGLYSKLPIKDPKVLHIGDALVPSIQAEVMVGGAPVTIIATHPVPPAGKQRSAWRNDQLAKLATNLPKEHPLILIGDLNATPWSHHFRQLLAVSGLKDSARGFGVQPTWPSFFAPLSIPIDHCLHSDEIHIHDRWIGDDVASDHFPVVIDFAVKN